MDLHKELSENEEQFLWRLGQAKDSGEIDLDWSEIADIMNAECREDETEYKSEAAYRKVYQNAKRFFDAKVFNKYQNENDYIEELRKAKQEVRKEKQRLFDERVALNKTLRDNARNEADLVCLENLIKESGKDAFPVIDPPAIESENSMIICLSDLHFGLAVSNYFEEYNDGVAYQRLWDYLNKLIEIKARHNAKNAYVFMLGDLLSGNIHLTVQLQNRENIIKQIQKSAELLSAFIYELSKHFENVYIDSVPGNHSRMSFKDQVLRDERLDELIPWYMSAKLSHLENIYFVPETENYDPTVGCVEINQNKYLLVHGDYDSFSESGISKLLMMLDLKTSDVDAIFYGHLHRCSYDDISNVKIIRSGSFCGTGDDFTVSKRLSGSPSQMVCVVGEHGIDACYPVRLR